MDFHFVPLKVYFQFTDAYLCKVVLHKLVAKVTKIEHAYNCTTWQIQNYAYIFNALRSPHKCEVRAH